MTRADRTAPRGRGPVRRVDIVHFFFLKKKKKKKKKKGGGKKRERANISGQRPQTRDIVDSGPLRPRGRPKHEEPRSNSSSSTGQARSDIERALTAAGKDIHVDAAVQLSGDARGLPQPRPLRHRCAHRPRAGRRRRSCPRCRHRNRRDRQADRRRARRPCHSGRPHVRVLRHRSMAERGRRARRHDRGPHGRRHGAPVRRRARSASSSASTSR